MFGVGDAVSLIGGVAGLFGGNKGGQNSGRYRSAQEGYLGGVNANAGRYGDLANQAFADYNRYRPQQGEAYDAYHSYLQRNPDTDQQFAFDTERAQQHSRSAYDAARAGVRSSLAARGFTDPSSLSTGGLQGVDLAEAADQSQAGQYAAQQAAARRQANLGADYGLTTGQANQAYGFGNEALGQQTSADQYLAGQYGGLADDAEAAAQAQAGDAMGSIGDLGALYSQGSAYKKALAKIMSPAATTPPFVPGAKPLAIGFGSPGYYGGLTPPNPLRYTPIGR